MKSTSDLLAFLKEKAEKNWKEQEQPYFLSMVSPELREMNIDYKSILGAERLKTFVQRMRSESGFKIVEHPTQKAKIAIIPSSENFEFEVDPKLNFTREAPLRDRRKSDNREEAVLSFLRLLGDLPKDDLDAINIPVRVLARLIRQP